MQVTLIIQDELKIAEVVLSNHIDMESAIFGVVAAALIAPAKWCQVLQSFKSILNLSNA